STRKAAARSRFRSYNQLGDLRPGEEAEGDECRADARRYVEHSGPVAIDPLDVAGAQVRESQLPARKREHDLARVQMSGEDEVERPGSQPACDAREVTEEDPEVGRRVGEPGGVRSAEGVRARVHPRHLHPLRAQLELERAVGEERDTLRK